jgi:hypothetical protein
VVTRSRILAVLKGKSKSKKTIELLGCSFEQAKQWIENQFKPGMTWENHGHKGWHIDHIRPCDAFDLEDPEQQKQCFRYTNLQPLWWQDNLSKNASVSLTLTNEVSLA